MKGFFWQDLKRSFLNRGFFAGLLVVAIFWYRQLFMHHWIKAEAVILL